MQLIFFLSKNATSYGQNLCINIEISLSEDHFQCQVDCILNLIIFRSNNNGPPTADIGILCVCVVQFTSHANQAYHMIGNAKFTLYTYMFPPIYTYCI